MQFLYFIPEIWFLIGICGIIIFGLYKKNDHFYIMYLSIWILVMTILGCNNFDVGQIIFFLNMNFVISPFIQFLKTIILILGIIIIYINYYSWESTNNKYEVYILILLLIWNFLILISINELILLVLFMEIHGIIAYTLTGKRENSSLAKEAMVKFFILGAIAVGFMGFGITIIYFILGSTNINEISILITDFYSTNLLLKNYIILIIGITFFIFGFLFKLTLVPFHFWIGDVYHSAPLSVILFFATIPVLCYSYLFSKIIFFLNIHLIIGILLLSIVYGTFMSIYQVKLMRLIGYSAIIHISYGLLGIVQGTVFGVKVGIFYIIVYCFLNIGLFLVIIILKDNKLINELHLIEIVDFLKILNPNIYLSNIVASIFFAMAGIPTLSGFFIKMYIYLSLSVSYNYIILILLLVIGIVTSVYYIRLVRLNLFNGQKNIDNIKILDINFIIILIFIFIINIFFIFFHLFNIIHIFSLI
jgi:NADH-quinone oxidoreductase subunit N